MVIERNLAKNMEIKKDNKNMLTNEILDIDLSQEPPQKEPERQYYYMALAKEKISEISKRLGRPLTFNVTTFGCQMNVRDSEKIVGILELMGYVASETEEADFVIYNTCTIRENANHKVYGHLGKMSTYKKGNPNMMIGLCGCMMQEPEVVEKLKKSYRYVDLIFGTHNIYKFAELVAVALDSKRMVIDIWKEADMIVENLPSERTYSFKSGVNIMYGCNNFCSYCIVPYVRGRERSRNPQDIVKEITDLVADGVVEVMLLGQNVNSYGTTLEEPMSFAELLKEIEAIEGLKRIRFMTSHPKDLSDDLIDIMANSKKICHHLHLPVQAGSSKVLKKMNRIYTKESYLETVRKIKAAIPEICISTDLIIGFPGETMEDVLETIDVIEQVEYDSAFTFIYSKRTGTPACTFETTASEEEVQKRFELVLEKVREISKKRTARHEGQVFEALIECVNEKNNSLVTGKLSNNITVHIKGDASMVGTFVDVKLVECKGVYYMGEIV